MNGTSEIMTGGFCSNDDGGAPGFVIDQENEENVESDKNARRISSRTNSFSGSIDSIKDQATPKLGGVSNDATNLMGTRDEPSSTDEICKSRSRESDEKGLSSMLHQTELDAPPSNNNHTIDESEAVSDISGSESDPSINEDWIVNESSKPIQPTHTICSIISNSDAGSLQSLRENVDRVLMSSGRSISSGRNCMQKDITPAAAQLLYDQNYYRSADWLRFVPKRSNSDASRGSNSSFTGGSGSNISPDPSYRMFDNTRIRVGLNLEHGKTVVRQHHTNEGMEYTPSQNQVDNFRLMNPDLVIDARIDEEMAEMEGDESSFDHGLVTAPPTNEIFCDPNSDSCQIAFEDDVAPQYEEYVHTQEQELKSNQAFHSSLRKGAIVRPSSDTNMSGQNHVHIHNLPEHVREQQMHMASWDSKYETYACRVDQNQDDRAVEIPLFSAARPHMRAFHFAWMSFFFAFLAWFSIAPLLGEIQESLGLTKEQIWTSSICSVAGGLVARCIMGVLCDIYGARLMNAVILFICGFPTCFTGFVNTSAGLSILRLFIGIGGSAFVTCQYWTSTMFTREVAGTANALAAGWGNLGGGVTLILTGSILFPFFEWMYGAAGAEDPSNLAWRTSCIIPGLVCTAFTFIILRSSDDSPKGNYRKRKRLGLMQKDSAMSHLKAGVFDYNTWILLIQYGCCFGVEITTTNAVALYFKEEFELSTASAAALGSIFGFMNIFFRGLGGFFSDMSNAYRGMRGRLFWQHLVFFLEGVFIIIFSRAGTLTGAIASLVVFSIFCQSAEGSTFGIVPYLNPSLTGTVAGIIGAGGNAGAVVFSVIFKDNEYRTAFFYMGLATISMSVLSNFVWIKGYQGLFLKRRTPPSHTNG